MFKKKYSKEFKFKFIKKYLTEGISYWKLSKDYEIETSIMRRWGDVFREEGIEPYNCNLDNYFAEFKQKIVAEYFAMPT